MGRMTQKAVAEQLGVSPTVVSLVLRDPSTNRASDETKARIFSLIEESNGETAPSQSPGSRNGDTILMVTENPESDYYFTNALLRGVQAGIAEHALKLQIATPAEDLRATLVSPRLRGILLGAYSGVQAEYQRYLDYASVVTLNAIERGPFIGQAVMPDYFMGFELAAASLAARGHRRIGYIGYQPESGLQQASRNAERLRHVQEACTWKPLTLADSDTRLIPKEQDNAQLRDLLADALKAWLSNDSLPTAIFIYNDLMAVQFYHVARDLGVVIPRDLSVVSVDNEPLCETLMPTLSSVSPEFVEVGQIAVDVLVAAAMNPNKVRPLKVLCPTRLELRESIAPARSE